MNTILIMIATAAIFFIGIQVGYKLKENKNATDTPKVQKIEEQMQNDKTNKEYNAEKEDAENNERLNKIMRNLDNFNGTKEGQVDID